MDRDACGWFVTLKGKWAWLSPATMKAFPALPEPRPTPAQIVGFIVDWSGTWFGITAAWWVAVYTEIVEKIENQEHEAFPLLRHIQPAPPPGMRLDDLVVVHGFRFAQRKKSDGSFATDMSFGGRADMTTLLFFPGADNADTGIYPERVSNEYHTLS